MSVETPSILNSTLEWLLSSNVTGVVTWIGTILSVAGLGFTYYQAREARKAANSAASGAMLAEQAVRRIENQTSMADAAYISAQIQLVIHLATSHQYPAIQIIFGTIKRHITIMLLRSPPSSEQGESIKRSISAVQVQIHKSIYSPSSYKATILSKSLNALADTINEWEQSLKSRRS